MHVLRLHFPARALVAAWAVATLFSGLPSTALALWAGTDPGEATWAAGAMLIDPDAGRLALFAAAALVHGSVSAFWTLIAGWVVRRQQPVFGALALSTVVGLLALGMAGPLWFPSIDRLAFWPQMADHWMWGLCLGVTLKRCSRPGRLTRRAV